MSPLTQLTATLETQLNASDLDPRSGVTKVVVEVATNLRFAFAPHRRQLAFRVAKADSLLEVMKITGTYDATTKAIINKTIGLIDTLFIALRKDDEGLRVDIFDAYSDILSFANSMMRKRNAILLKVVREILWNQIALPLTTGGPINYPNPRSIRPGSTGSPTHPDAWSLIDARDDTVGNSRLIRQATTERLYSRSDLSQEEKDAISARETANSLSSAQAVPHDPATANSEGPSSSGYTRRSELFAKSPSVLRTVSNISEWKDDGSTTSLKRGYVSSDDDKDGWPQAS
jgi:hypothetical protein